jgi:hypothetical protein
MNVEIGAEAALFPEKEYINGIAVPVCLCYSIVTLVKNIIFLTEHFFTLLVPIAQQPGQAGVLGRLSLCLWKQ